MLPFSIFLKSGFPVTEQILYAVKRAVVAGQLRPGDKFPSVRNLSRELRINPNTAHKVVAALVDQGVLVTTPGIGSLIATPEAGNRKDCAQLLGSEVERLVVEAIKLGLNEDEVRAAVARHWEKLSKSSMPSDLK